MAYETECYEIQSGSEEIWGKYSVEGCYRQDLVIDEINEDVVIYGRVLDADGKGVSGILLNVFACMENGLEMSLAFTYSGKDGSYMFAFKEPEEAVARYMIRTGCR